MITLLNIFNTIADSNLAYYLLVLILVIVAISMIYLIYSQNKEIKIAKRRNMEEESDNTIAVQNVKESNDMVEDLAKEIRNGQVDQEEALEKLGHTMNTPIRDSIINEIKDEDVQDDKVNINAEIINDFSANDVYEEVKAYNNDDNFKSDGVEDKDISVTNKKDIIDATMTNIPKINLLDETITALPPLMDYEDSTQELIDLTKELETLPRERAIKLTPYEEEQEQNAIISYDELVNANEGVIYKDEVKDDDLDIKQVDLDRTTKVEVNDKQISKETYAHEELFLRRLKSLQSKIN